MDYYFRTSDLTVGYSGKALIKDINIQVSSGEIVTLIGPNGAGKSTILKSITKHLEMISGNVKIADASIRSMSYKALAQKLAVVLTERVKGELLTCWDVVASGRYPYTDTLGLLSDSDREKIDEALEKVNGKELAERDFGAISDGQRQRILLARAICQEPEIIVLDEPTSFLDIRHKLELLDILHTMAKEKNITVIMSLHEIDLAQKISDKVVCVGGNEIKHFGVPDEIFKEEIINDLYGIKDGTYNIVFGSVELPKPEGEPEVFVIAGNGTGVNVFRHLQKKGIPFCTGIIYENDVDYQVAKNLAAKVFSEEPFEPIGDKVMEDAMDALRKCDKVINAGPPVGSGNIKLQNLIDEGAGLGKLVTINDL